MEWKTATPLSTRHSVASASSPSGWGAWNRRRSALPAHLLIIELYDYDVEPILGLGGFGNELCRSHWDGAIPTPSTARRSELAAYHRLLRLKLFEHGASGRMAEHLWDHKFEDDDEKYKQQEWGVATYARGLSTPRADDQPRLRLCGPVVLDPVGPLDVGSTRLTSNVAEPSGMIEIMFCLLGALEDQRGVKRRRLDLCIRHPPGPQIRDGHRRRPLLAARKSPLGPVAMPPHPSGPTKRSPPF